MRKLLRVAVIALILAGCSTRDTVTVVATLTAASLPTRAGPTATPAGSARLADSPTREPEAEPTVENDPDLQLPDLRTLPPSDVQLDSASAAGRKLLRFTNSLWNDGAGALEVLGVLNTDIGKTVVTQNIYRLDGTIEEHLAGEFIFHVGHNHWHLENHARYEVWSLTIEGEPERVVALTDKISYCLRDDSRGDTPGGPEAAVYLRCNREKQGMSVGWVDTYDFDTQGQTVDVTKAPDGIYLLRSTVDPENQLRESDDANNSAAVYIEITGDEASILDRATALRRLRVVDD
jgi:hypothetical protein